MSGEKSVCVTQVAHAGDTMTHENVRADRSAGEPPAKFAGHVLARRLSHDAMRETPPDIDLLEKGLDPVAVGQSRA